MAKPISAEELIFVKQKALDSMNAKDDGEGLGPTREHVEELVEDVFRMLSFGGFLDRQSDQTERPIPIKPSSATR